MIPVIIPSYRKPEQLAKCVVHLEAQTVGVETFIRDNSVDNVYFTAAINEGLSRYLDEDCRYMVILNQDMYLQPNAVEEMIRFMDSHLQCGIGTPLQLHSENPDFVVCAGCLEAFPFGKHQQGPITQFIEDAQLFWGNGACMILRKQMVREIGLLDKNLVFIGSDSDYCFTARARGWQVWRIAAARGVHEHGASGAVADPGLDRLKINDMLYFGRKWLTGGLYRELAAEGLNCTAEVIETIMNQLADAAAELQQPSPNPEDVTAYTDAAIALQRAGRHAEAIEKCRQAASIKTDDARPHHVMGFVLQTQGRCAEAMESYRRAIALRPDFAPAHDHLGVVLSEQGRCDEAIDCHKKAIELAPDCAGAYNNLAIALGAESRFDEAIANYRRALSLEPDLVDAHYNLANILREQGRHEEAIASYGRAIELQPAHAGAFNNLSRTLKDSGRVTEALETCERAIALNLGLAEAHNNRGLLFKALGRYAEAVESFEKAIQLRPDYANAHWNYGLALLSGGRFADGWQEYQWRTKAKLGAIPDSQRETSGSWDGRHFAGKRLLIRYEQGLGDNLQFVRYVPIAKALGGTVMLETPEPLWALLEGFEGVDELVEASPSGRPTVQFDLDVFLLDLPRIFGTTAETIPADIPYIHPDQTRSDIWSRRMGDDGFRVGLVWAGSPRHTNDSNRSCRLEHFEPVRQIDGVRLFGLQKGPAAAQAGTVQDEMPFENLGDELDDFADTAAVIDNLDLVISVDTAVLHLAGAMGKEVWALLPFDADWRWLRDRQDSPWYPTMKLFRQSRPGDWNGVFDRVSTELRELAGTLAVHING